jgi:hypothetical protein
MWMGLDVIVESRELQVPPNVASALALDRQGLSAKDWPPLGEPSRGFLGGEGTSSRGLMGGPGSPHALGIGGVVCPIL